MVVRITSDAASNTSGIQSWRRGPRAPKKRRAAPTGVKAMGWGRKRTATAKRMNTYASMDHLERHSILGAVEAGVKREDAANALMFSGGGPRVERRFDITAGHRGWRRWPGSGTTT